MLPSILAIGKQYPSWAFCVRDITNDADSILLWYTLQSYDSGSGGPVFDERGHVVGIASAHLRGAGYVQQCQT